MKLTIAVITMNRCKQLIEALQSCVKCTMEADTEFVIIDNASTDNTQSSVHDFFRNYSYNYYYERLNENLGVGRGRNYAISKSHGEYVYVLDDDAVIDDDINFFVKAIKILDETPAIITLTTQIYDTVLKKNRIEKKGPQINERLFKCRMFCGGSHFLRNGYFKENVYFPNKYGYEELLPSLLIYNNKKLNVFAPELRVIHNPQINKWDFTDKKNHELLINECAVPFAMKSMIFPVVVRPISWFLYKIRVYKYLRNISCAVQYSDKKVKETRSVYPINEKISLFTVARLVKDFGIGVL